MRELGQLFLGLGVGLVGLALLVATAVSVALTVPAGFGIPVFLGTTWLVRRQASWRRRWAGVEDPYRPVPTGRLARFRTVVADPATWRDLAYLAAQFAAGGAGVVVAGGVWLVGIELLFAPLLRVLVPVDTAFAPAVLEFTHWSTPAAWLLAPVGLLVLAVAYRLPRYLLGLQRGLARRLLGPTATRTLSARVEQLTVRRGDALDANAAELRRVERDLHDGAQVRLVALAMDLGMAEDIVDTDPAAAKILLNQARANAAESLAELRRLVRGIHPPVLADRGLAGAVPALALICPIPVEVALNLPRRLPAAVESAAYFAVAEAVTNAVRHSGAGRVRVELAETGATLRMRVHDDGHGGADPARGTGLRGIDRRLSTFDGSAELSSPPGGPTVLIMELPCGC